MEWTKMLPIVLIAACSGFAVYCFSCAVHVWRRRNGRTACLAKSSNGIARWLRPLFLVAFIAGSVFFIAALVMNLVAPRQGPLHGERVVTIRPPKELHVAWTTQNELVEANETLARFTGPEHEAEIRAVRLRLEELRTESLILSREPVEPDPEIPRKLQELANEHRHLRSSLVELEIEKQTVERQRVQQKLTQQDQINQLEAELVQLREQRAQAGTELDFNRKQLQRAEHLVRKKVTTEHDHEEWTRDVEVAEVRSQRLDERIGRVESQKAQLEEGLIELVRVLDAQSQSYGEQIATARRRLQETTDEHQAMEDLLRSDLDRAAELREQEIARKETQLQQAEAKLEGLVEALHERAPFRGHVVYRDPSPGTVKQEEPLLVLAPEEGLRLRLRLPLWHRSTIQKSVPIPLELIPVAKEDGEPVRHFVEKRFTGLFKQWHSLPDDPWYGVAELVCMPPAEAVEELAAGEEVLVKLRWWVPFFHHPLFIAGIVLCAVGGVGMLVTGALRRRAETLETGNDALSGHGSVDDPVFAEYGAEGSMLRLLGCQLREIVQNGHIDHHVLSAAEWALDRHRARAIRLMQNGLGDGETLEESMQNLVTRSCISWRQGTNGVPRPGELRRLLRLIEAVASGRLRKQAASLLRQAEHHPHRHKLQNADGEGVLPK